MPLPGLAERFEKAAHAVLRRGRDGLLEYQPHAGRAADRAAGAQHAITLALLAVAKPGAVAIEALAWPGLRASAAALC